MNQKLQLSLSGSKGNKPGSLSHQAQSELLKSPVLAHKTNHGQLKNKPVFLRGKNTKKEMGKEYSQAEGYGETYIGVYSQPILFSP